MAITDFQALKPDLNGNLTPEQIHAAWKDIYNTNAPDKVVNDFAGHVGGNDASFYNRVARGDFSAEYGGGGGGPGATSSFTQPTIDLPRLYETAYAGSGIKEKQDQMSKYRNEYTDAIAKIKDNPFLSEATQVGRVAKLDSLYQNRTANLQNDIAVSKADIETKLALQTKQFDIDSQQARQALDQFNALLGSGSLDNATGQDIAGFVKATGMSSGMIYSAIQASKAARATNTKSSEIPTQTIQFDDGTNKGYAIINSQTGEIINKQVVAASTPTAAEQKAALSGGKVTTGGGAKLSSTQQTKITTQARKSIVNVDKNKDKLLSLQEYKDAVSQIMTSTGVDFATADDYATKAFTELGYHKWRW